jgi:hypothetical protein
LAAILTGAAVGFFLRRPADDASGKPDSPIEWNEVQAVPTRTPTPDEIEWEKRGRDGPVMASDGDAAQEMPRVFRGRATDDPPVAKQPIYAFDGDTFDMGGQRIRVANIDAPELHPSRCAEEERLGQAAKARLSALLNSGTVTMSGSGHDQYGRELRNVQVNGQDVGEAMIAAGVAREYGSGRKPWC